MAQVDLILDFDEAFEPVVHALVEEIVCWSTDPLKAGVIFDEKIAGRKHVCFPNGIEPTSVESVHKWLEAAETCGLISHWCEYDEDGDCLRCISSPYNFFTTS